MIHDLKITTVLDNMGGTFRNGCVGQWGLSFLLELLDARGHTRKVLFDSGYDKKAFFHNLRQLKIHLDDVDCVVLSHGHRDHTGATAEIAKTAGSLRVYAHPHTFMPRFREHKSGKSREIGVEITLSEIEKAGGKILLTREPTEVVPGVWTTGEIPRITSFEFPLPLSEGERLTIEIDGTKSEDRILDDQAIWMIVDSLGPFVITGCAHAGLANTLLEVQRTGHLKQIYALIGGTHLVRRSETYLQRTLHELKQFGLRLISPCHCTGFKATVRLWQAFPKEFASNFSGRILEAEKHPREQVI